jgi:hypothetical protein
MLGMTLKKLKDSTRVSFNFSHIIQTARSDGLWQKTLMLVARRFLQAPRSCQVLNTTAGVRGASRVS